MINAAIRLMRLDKPIGSFLLWYPAAWALWAANQGSPAFKILFFFALGTLVMRSAGCVINDILDRKFDKQVKRTEKRPLATAELSLKFALFLASVLLGIALFILLNLPYACMNYAFIALFLTLIYPLGKRFIKAPQCVLGLAFSMGIPMAYAASGVAIDSAAILLFVINSLWILAYDTLYAMADKQDDLRVGIKSTAVYFGAWDKSIVMLLQIFMHGFWLVWAYNMQMKFGFYLLWMFAAVALFWQQGLIRNVTPETCLRAFMANNYYGALMWAAIVSGLVTFPFIS